MLAVMLPSGYLSFFSLCWHPDLCAGPLVASLFPPLWAALHTTALDNNNAVLSTSLCTTEIQVEASGLLEDRETH